MASLVSSKPFVAPAASPAPPAPKPGVRVLAPDFVAPLRSMAVATAPKTLAVLPAPVAAAAAPAADPGRFLTNIPSAPAIPQPLLPAAPSPAAVTPAPVLPAATTSVDASTPVNAPPPAGETAAAPTQTQAAASTLPSWVPWGVGLALVVVVVAVVATKGSGA